MKFRVVVCLFILFTAAQISIGSCAAPATAKLDKPTILPRALIFAFPGYASRETITRRFAPFADYLAGELKRKIVIKVLSNYFEVLEQLEKDSVDLAQLTPVLYTSVMESPELEFLGIQVVNGEYFYQSQIIVPRDSPITNLMELKGKTIGFTNIFSGSGFIIPMLDLKEKGLITPSGEKLFEAKMLDDHDKLVYNLLKKRIDAGATYDAMVEDNRNSVRVVHKVSIPIPQDVFVANRSTLDEGLLEAIREAFRKFWDRTGKSHVERFHGNDKIYQDFRKIIKP